MPVNMSSVFDLRLYLRVLPNSKGSDETVGIRRLVLALAAQTSCAGSFFVHNVTSIYSDCTWKKNFVAFFQGSSQYWALRVYD